MSGECNVCGQQGCVEDNHPTEADRLDRTYLDLKGAHERLCRAMVHVPEHWRGELDRAVGLVDMVGSAVCSQQWSKYDQPEYPEVTT